ncbi:alanine racemase [Sulfitobacter donghicola]|uniref:Alanine racemase n=1 Tax=Sulfitobacter donghicola DSW-25 = KCTC 12864 = JCM 14565 TaxID=1300350 RepID=A0A073IVS1_9RHOB|nr:alanine racemase [Sulfitobacter donghicola]KEJ89467.1 alanine racemase [Sulfitobacter donghicola DSW-25 = KCTC 12864 = JCM 14565]KIN69288.1 Alanine racemase [Sulfitobacter donghicola DSW-25 = KCTC 12864 = JCM 14565]
MSTATLHIDLEAIATNWRSLASIAQVETAAVVKANGYGLDAGRVAQHLAKAGARQFFVAVAEEGVILRRALGAGPTISVFSGHMAGDAEAIKGANLTPMINSVDQMLRHVEALPGHPFGLQLDTGMNRLGMEPAEWSALRDIALAQNPTLIMSHLACADMPDHPMNEAQRTQFENMTQGLDIPRSLAATGGTLLGADYHYDLVRPGVGLYGGLPFAEARPVVTLDIPVIQTRDVAVGETVGYANAWRAQIPSKVATISAGYADGLIRAMGDKAQLFADGVAVPVIGRVSMDLITVDVTALPSTPASMQLLGPEQTVDDVADFAGTIGYEILTSLGGRYNRVYHI